MINVARLLPPFCFAVVLVAADNESATGDPFAASHQAIQSQLSAMLEHEHEQAQKVQQTQAVEPERSAQHSAPNADNEGDVRHFARRFWGGREAELAAALDRLGRLRPTLESILDSEGVPKQLVAVVLVESGAQALATSPREARGLWQFIPATAQQYGLTVNDQRDERVQLELATRAAARYLRDLYMHFGDWPLALAAYNAGQGAIDSALQKGRLSTFGQLSSAGVLPQETRNYVPAVLAAMQLLGASQPALPVASKVQRDNWVYASSAPLIDNLRADASEKP